MEAEGDENINLQWIFENIKDELNAVKFLQRFKIIPMSKMCKRKHEMSLKCINTNVIWRCQRGICNEKASVRSNNWLEGSTIPLKKIVLHIYCWSREYNSVKFCEKELNINKNTMVDFNNYLKEVSILLNFCHNLT